MSPFWVGLFENLRDRGRNATLFIVALAVLVCLLLASGPNHFNDVFCAVIACLALVAVMRFGWLICGACFGKRDRTNISRLSSDELTKARSKLLRNQKRGGI